VATMPGSLTPAVDLQAAMEAYGGPGHGRTVRMGLACARRGHAAIDGGVDVG
jgi:hypothetical protein